jgi:hypothetical protein
MHLVLIFLRAVWSEWVALLTGGGIMAMLGLWERRSGNVPVPGQVYWAIVLLTLVLTLYRVWKSEYLRAQGAERRIVSERPHVAIEYHQDREARNQHVTLRNTSTFPAYNIQIQPLIYRGQRVTFPPVARLEAGQHAHVHANVEGAGLLFLHDLRSVFEHDPPNNMAVYIEPALISLSASYTDFGGTGFGTASTVEYNRVSHTARTIAVGGADPLRPT